MEEEEFETRSDEIKRIVGDLHEQGLTEAQILQKLMEYLGVPISWEKAKDLGEITGPAKDNSVIPREPARSAGFSHAPHSRASLSRGAPARRFAPHVCHWISPIDTNLGPVT